MQCAGRAPVSSCTRQLRAATAPAVPAIHRVARHQKLIQHIDVQPDQAARSVRCRVAQPAGARPVSTSNTSRLAGYFFLWYSFNIVFNIVNKATLNAFPMPWFIATWQLAASGLFMCLLWATKIHPVPSLPRGFWKALLPVAFFHTIGHVAACVSFSKMAVSFTHIIKASEPVFTVALSGVLQFKSPQDSGCIIL